MIYTENTPNPNALKFVSKNIFSEVGVQEFQKKDEKKIQNSFIKNLLQFDGVELILISKNFISVKKSDSVIAWDCNCKGEDLQFQEEYIKKTI